MIEPITQSRYKNAGAPSRSDAAASKLLVRISTQMNGDSEEAEQERQCGRGSEPWCGLDNICNMGGNGSRGSLAHRGTVRALARCQKPVPHHFAVDCFECPVQA